MDDALAPPPTAAALVARARDIGPYLAERAARTEANRSMLPEVFETLREAGFFRILQARRYGGYELGVAAHTEVVIEIARHCASSAWVLGLCTSQNRFIGCYPKEAQDDVWAASGADPVTALVTGPTATAEKVDGGYLLTGRWPYVSGVDQCNWLLLSAFDPEAPEIGARHSLTCLIPKSDVADVLDDWYVMGLRGTGSRTVVLERCFVPAHRAMNFWNYDDALPPGAEVNDGALFQGIPRIVIFAITVAAPAVGLALAAAHALRARLEQRRSPLMANALTENQHAQATLGSAIDRAAAAKELLMGAARGFQARAEAGDVFGAEDRLTYRLRATEVLRQATQVVDDVFAAAGTGAMFDSNPLQRMFRDVHAVRSHVVLDPVNAAENVGRLALGIDPKPPYI